MRILAEASVNQMWSPRKVRKDSLPSTCIVMRMNPTLKR